MADTEPKFSERTLLGFLEPQIRDYGGKVELDENYQILFAVPKDDEEANEIAQTLLSEATFPVGNGESEDDAWKLYFIDKPMQLAATDWLAARRARLAGEILPLSSAHKEMIAELSSSTMPHRVAQKLADLHGAYELSAGVINDPKLVRELLDRLHVREPLYYSAYLKLLTSHLIDMTVLMNQMIGEDIQLANEIVKSGLSRDPFLQSRQDAMTEIRKFLIRFNVISAIDQGKGTIPNPYAAYLEVVVNGDKITANIDGNTANMGTANFLSAIRSIRRNLYSGAEFASFNTQVPWITEEIAYPFRFIKQKLQTHRDLLPMDGLYIMERAITG